MYKKRHEDLLFSLQNFKFKKVQINQGEALLFEYSPEQGSDPWNAWSCFPWEYDPWLYKLYRRSLSALIVRFRKRRAFRLPTSKYMYMLDNFEINFDMYNFPFWHSNELPSHHAFGFSYPKGLMLEAYMPQEFYYLPYPFFALLRYTLLNFHRFRSVPSKANLPWGFTFSFGRVPSWMFKIPHECGILRVAWALPWWFLQRWIDMEHEEWENPHNPQFVNYFENWSSTDDILTQLWNVPEDLGLHELMMEEMEDIGVKRGSSKGAKHFFVYFALYFWHIDYEYYAINEPRLFHYYAYPYQMRVHWLRWVIYHTKECDILRFYMFCIYQRIQFDTEYTDTVLKFVSWLEFLTWKGQWFGPIPDVVRTYRDTFDSYVSAFNKKFGLPFFSRIRKTFFKKK